jgi:integrase
MPRQRDPHLTQYTADGQTWWRIVIRVTTPEGSRRIKEGRIPTYEQARARLAEIVHAAYENKAFDVQRPSTFTVAEAWKFYAPVSKRDKRSAPADVSRSAHVLQHLGSKCCEDLTEADVETYRNVRLTEMSARRHRPPAPATLDREMALLKGMLTFCKRCGKIAHNPLVGVAMLDKPNTREVVLTNEQFEAGLARLGERSAWMREVLTLSFETGLRIGEVLHLEKKRIDRETGRFELRENETKNGKPRIVYLSSTLLDRLKALPTHVSAPWLFFNPKTGQPRGYPRTGFKTAFGKGVNVHDLRRSFATGARRAGVPESVVMKMGGWRTPAMFRRYNIVEEDDVRDAARRLEDLRRVAPGSPGPSRRHDPEMAPVESLSLASSKKPQ